MELDGNLCLPSETASSSESSAAIGLPATPAETLARTIQTLKRRRATRNGETSYLAVNGGSRQWWKELADFWKAPASVRGYHRPNQTQGDHSRRVFKLACRHWHRVPFDHLRRNRRVCRSFLRAALFHDVGKITDRRRHEVESFHWMLPRDELAAFLVLHHMGRWSCVNDAEKRDLLEQAGILHLLTPEHLWLADLLCAVDFTEACCWDIT